MIITKHYYSNHKITVLYAFHKFKKCMESKDVVINFATYAGVIMLKPR